jgi:2-dehydro-3-deoxy-D-arabinonate dehydratase
MKLYKINQGIVIEKENTFFFLPDEPWDAFVNDDNLYQKMSSIVQNHNPDENVKRLLSTDLRAPIHNQEIWAAGVTYFRSKVGRQEESQDTGGAQFYARVYEAERPEIFFKSSAYRCVGHKEKVRIRPDSTWDVPEPELTLMITTSGRIVGYTIGNDMSSRSIEGENPLYLPQAKSYDKSAAIGPCIWVTDQPLAPETSIHLEIFRDKKVFEGTVAISQIKRSFEELVSYLYKAMSFPYGSLLMTGTGIVPGNDFTLKSRDEIHITIEPIGKLVNEVE